MLGSTGQRKEANDKRNGVLNLFYNNTSCCILEYTMTLPTMDLPIRLSEIVQLAKDKRVIFFIIPHDHGVMISVKDSTNMDDRGGVRITCRSEDLDNPQALEQILRSAINQVKTFHV